jgi:hypothetical protein
MASTKYCINKELLEIITNNTYYKKEECDNKTPILHFNTHEESNNIDKHIKDKNYKMIYEIVSYNSKNLYETSLLSLAKLMSYMDEFYITNFID